jgi:methylase of polypeptide subunit release factors
MDDVRLYEPPEALLDTRSPTGDGLGFYRALAVEGGSRLRSGGLVAVEVGAGQAPRVVEIFRESGWIEEGVTRDYGGIDRVVSVRKPEVDAEILRTASAGP